MINLYTLDELLDEDFTEQVVDNWIKDDTVTRVNMKRDKLLKKQFIEEKNNG